MVTLKELKQLKLIQLCHTVTFTISGLIINFIQLLLYLLLKPFNTHLYRSLNYYLCFSIYSHLVFLTEWWSQSRLEVWIDDADRLYPGKEHALIIMNHSYEIDLLTLWMYADKCQVLGNVKAYAKKEVTYIPCLGWSWKFAEFILLERQFDKDKEIISRQLNEILSYRYPVGILLYAEGTRFTPQKHIASVKYAEKQGLPVLKHHLIPRTKGFTISLPTLRNRCTIYDVNIAFKKDTPLVPSISNLLKGNSFKACMYVRRIPLDNVPEDEEKAAQWLHELYREKDRIQDSFHQTGSFFTTSGFQEPRSTVLKPRLRVLINYIAWATFSVLSVAYFLVVSLLSQNWMGFSVTIFILLACEFIKIKAVGSSEINKGSKYGVQIEKEKQAN